VLYAAIFYLIGNYQAKKEIFMIGDKIKELQKIIDESNNIVFFGGAGVSTESNIPDFRSSDGIFHMSYQYPPEQVVSYSFFKEYPEEFYKFYKSKIMVLEALPNPAHIKLAELEKIGKLKAVITQNIDGLHQKAGSENVLELHGSIWRNYCMECNAYYEAKAVKEAAGVPRCSCSGVIKPDVVLYQEGLDPTIINKTIAAIREADTLIIGGTSLAVYPAAGFIDYFRGNHIVVINKTDMERSVHADLNIGAPIGEVLSRIAI
jgi:NAD-dependent deacetylase